MSSTVAERIQHELLPRISKPNRYLGDVRQVPPKDLDATGVRVLLGFPDAFEIGFSNLGIHILQHILNRRPDTIAELVFAPWPDAEAEMRRLGIPLFSLTSHAPAAGFDVLGFSLQYELQYTNVLTMLDLAGLPLRSLERDGRHPLVIAGGAQAFGPEPMAEFMDAFVVGDGEEIVHPLVDLVRQAKRERLERSALLRRLARLPGVYVPRGYVTDATPEGWLVPRARPGYPERVESVWVRELRPEHYPPAPPLPAVLVSKTATESTMACMAPVATSLRAGSKRRPSPWIIDEASSMSHRERMTSPPFLRCTFKHGACRSSVLYSLGAVSLRSRPAAAQPCWTRIATERVALSHFRRRMNRPPRAALASRVTARRYGTEPVQGPCQATSVCDAPSTSRPRGDWGRRAGGDGSAESAACSRQHTACRLACTSRSRHRQSIRGGAMRRVVFIALTIVVVLGAAGASWAEEAGGTKPIQIALFSPVQIVPEEMSILGLRLNLLYGKNHDMTGLDLGLVNHVTGSAFAWQLGVVGYVERDFTGWQDNWVNITRGSFTGFQSGVVNHAASSKAAFQLGVVNHGEAVTGFELGWVNYTESMNGLQVGGLNWTKKMHGLQIGIGNIIETGKYPFLPLVNWNL